MKKFNLLLGYLENKERKKALVFFDLAAIREQGPLGDLVSQQFLSRNSRSSTWFNDSCDLQNASVYLLIKIMDHFLT